MCDAKPVAMSFFLVPSSGMELKAELYQTLQTEYVIQKLKLIGERAEEYFL